MNRRRRRIASPENNAARIMYGEKPQYLPLRGARALRRGDGGYCLAIRDGARSPR